MAIVLLIGCSAYAKPRLKKAIPIPEVENEDQICFAMYTVHNNILKMMVQLYPLADGDSREVILEIKDGKKWKTVAETQVRENEYGVPRDSVESHNVKAWNALFRVEGWDSTKDYPYRVSALDGQATYEGLIRHDPVEKEEIVVAAFTGNSNKDRSPRSDLVENVKKQDPGLLFFSGDQSYDHHDHLYAWLLFGKQFGELIRDRPTVAIPDDHDVGQANLWGMAGSVRAKHIQGPRGGYYMPPEYVKEVEFAQTGNLPDPFDPTSIGDGIGVYYTSLNIGGVDFAIIEDRKFKSAPVAVETPGHGRIDLIGNPDYDRKSVDLPGGRILGDRQLRFLRKWGQNWRKCEMKCVLSQTIFAQACHKSGRDVIVADLDSNGWPQTARNNALREIRKTFSFMIAGDQHLATVIHHGIDDWNDSGYSFCVPSIMNYWPR